MFGATQLGGEHNALSEHEQGRDGPVSKAVEGSTRREVFETYLEQVLAPSLRPGLRWW